MTPVSRPSTSARQAASGQAREGLPSLPGLQAVYSWHVITRRIRSAASPLSTHARSYIVYRRPCARTSHRQALEDALGVVEADPAATALVLAAEGKFFCNGIDMAWIDFQATPCRRAFPPPPPPPPAAFAHCPSQIPSLSWRSPSSLVH